MAAIPLIKGAAAASSGLGVASGLMTLAGGIFSARGVRQQNQFNREMAREQMSFQRNMSNTAYQRSARDLEAAGLNRIIALGSSASTPSGQTARMENTKAPIGKAIQSAPTTALSIAHQAQQIKNLQATEASEKARKWNIEADTRLKGESQFKITNETQNIILQNAGIKTNNEILELDRQIRSLRIPGMTAEADLWRWLADKGADEISKLIPGAGKLVGSVLRMYIVYMKNPGASTPGAAARNKVGPW